MLIFPRVKAWHEVPCLYRRNKKWRNWLAKRYGTQQMSLIQGEKWDG